MTTETMFSLEAEQAVIAGIIVNPQLIIEVREKLLPEFFYHKQNELVYQALLDISMTNKQIDFITLNEQLRLNNTLEKVGGIDNLVDLAEDISIAINVEDYVEIVYEKFLTRKVYESATNILNRTKTEANVNALIEYSEKEIVKLAEMTRTEEFVNWQQLLIDVKNQIEELASRDKKGLIGLNTGYKNLNDITGGLNKGDMIIIAARPSVGKTAFLLNLVRNIVINTDNSEPSVAIFSLEMGADQLLTRLLSIQSQVPISKIRMGDLTPVEQEDLNYGFESLKAHKIHIDETPGITIGELKSKCRKLKLEQGLDLVTIDYLQLITTAANSDSRQQEVSEISRELKSLAKELKVPVIALSQLSRAVEQRADKKPMMSDIRESGSIEQDADMIMMLYRPEYYGTHIDLEDSAVEYEGKTELIITKHRNGPTGELEFKFDKESNKFIGITQEEY